METTTYILEGKTITKTDKGDFWRLIYDNEDNVVALFESDGITQTPLNIFIASTKEECLSKIDELELIYEEEDEEEETNE